MVEDSASEIDNLLHKVAPCENCRVPMREWRSRIQQIHLEDQETSIGWTLCNSSSSRLASIWTESSVIPIHVNLRTWVGQKVFFWKKGMLNSSNRARTWQRVVAQWETGHAQEFPVIRVDRNNAESRLNVSFRHKTAVAREIAPSVHIYWGCWHSGSLGTLGVRQVEDSMPLLAVCFADKPRGMDLKILKRTIWRVLLGNQVQFPQGGFL